MRAEIQKNVEMSVWKWAFTAEENTHNKTAGGAADCTGQLPVWMCN